jgi:hypothetical protein
VSNDDEEEFDNEGGHFAVPGKESHESPETLSPDERGDEEAPLPGPSEPKQPAPG